MPGVLGNYEVIKTLGSGGTAKVKLARDKESNTEVALKVMYSENFLDDLDAKLNLLRQEVEKISSINHPHVVKFLSSPTRDVYQKKSGENKYAVFVALEYCSKGCFIDYLLGEQSLSDRLVRRFFRQLVQTVADLYAQGVSHRDLKPDNLLLDHEYNLKVCDFGFSQFLEGSQGDGLHRTYVGTKTYIAPEIHERKPYKAEKADVFSLGVCLFIFLTRGYPFNKGHPHACKLYRVIFSSTSEIFWKYHERENPEAAPLFTPSFRDLFFKMIAYKPEKRITMQEVIEHEWFNEDFATEEEAKAEI